MIIQWTNFRRYGSVETLTFQAHIFSNGNIEFAYETMTVTGGSATVGIEAVGGVDGVEHSYNTAGMVGTGDGLSFTRL